MICAVLEARAAVDLTGQDLFVNVAGGVRIQETGIDQASRWLWHPPPDEPQLHRT